MFAASHDSTSFVQTSFSPGILLFKKLRQCRKYSLLTFHPAALYTAQNGLAAPDFVMFLPIPILKSSP